MNKSMPFLLRIRDTTLQISASRPTILTNIFCDISPFYGGECDEVFWAYGRIVSL
jgi:hypothetical protein